MKAVSYLCLIVLGLCSTEKEFLDTAKSLLSQGKYSEAIDQYSKALLLNENHITYFRRASTYQILAKDDKAIEDYSKVLALKENSQARLNRGQLLLKQGSFEGAIKDLQSQQELLATATEAKQALDNLQPCNFDQLDLILRASPKFEKILEQRAFCYSSNNDHLMAVNDFSKLIKLRPNDLQLTLTLSELYAKMGEFDNQIQVLKGCLKKDPDQSLCISGFKKTKKFQKKLVSLEKLKEKRKWSKILEELIEGEMIKDIEALGADPVRKQIYLYAAECYKIMKKYNEAISFASKVLELDPDLNEPRIIRGEAYLEIDEFEKAKNDFKAAHDQDRQNQRVIFV
jgi:DnaJ family protein C protein 3